MKKPLIIVSILLVIGLGFYFLLNQKKEKNVIDTKGWASYKIEKTDIEFQYPKDWIFRGTEGLWIGIKYDFQYPSDVYVEDEQRLHAVVTIHKSIEELTNYFIGNNVSIEQDSKIKLGSRSWQEIILTESKKEPLYLLATKLDKNVIFFMSPNDPEKRKLLQDMAASLKGSGFDLDEYFSQLKFN